MVPLQGAFAARRHLRAHVCARGNDKKKLDRRKKNRHRGGLGRQADDCNALFGLFFADARQSAASENPGDKVVHLQRKSIIQKKSNFFL
jgi:hypothetical protein